MKTIYVVTSKYMPLIANEDFSNPSLRVRISGRIIHTQDISKDIIENTFSESKNYMLAFNTKDEADIVMKLGLRKTKTTSDFIDGQIPFFAVPVVFGVEIEDNLFLEENKDLTGLTVFNYFETKSIPWYAPQIEQGFFKDSIIKGMDDKINELDSCPKMFYIAKENICNKLTASYLAANPVREANIKLSTPKQDLENTSSLTCTMF